MITYSFKKRIVSAGTVVAVAGLFVVAVPAFAQQPAPAQPGNINPASASMHDGGRGVGVAGMGMSSTTRRTVGTVTEINGTTITISSRQGFGPNAANVTFTVDASHATVTESSHASSSVSSIVVGNMIVVQGTKSGNTIIANTIRKELVRGGIGMEPADSNANAKGARGSMVNGTPYALTSASSDIDTAHPQTAMGESGEQNPEGFFGSVGMFFSNMFGSK